MGDRHDLAEYCVAIGIQVVVVAIWGVRLADGREHAHAEASTAPTALSYRTVFRHWVAAGCAADYAATISSDVGDHPLPPNPAL